MKIKTKFLIIAIAVMVTVSLGVWLLLWPTAFVYGLRRYVDEREKTLLYGIDHAALASELRKFAADRRWLLIERNSEPDIFWENDTRLPAPVRILKPTSVVIYDDRVKLECGGPFIHFGIVAFREGLVGQGLKQLAPGVWFYAEDGWVPSP